MSQRNERVWVAACAALMLGLLLWGLGGAALWEDESASAVLGARTLRYGLPYAWDGHNWVTRERGMDANERGLWIFEPWAALYVTAASLALCGRTQFGARFLPALCGWLAALLVIKAVRDHSKLKGAPLIAAALFATSVPYLLYCRQSRYYPLVLLSEALFILTFLDLRLAFRRIAACALALLLLFYTHPLNFAVFLPAALFAGALFGREKLASLAISSAAALLGALPWVLYSGMLHLGTAGSQISRAGLWGLRALAAHGLASLYAPYYLAGCAAAAACVPLLRAKTLERLQAEPLLKLALALLLVPAGAAAYLTAARVSNHSERFVLVTLIPGLLLLSLLLGALAQDRPWLGYGLLAVLAVTPFGMVSPLGIEDALPTLRSTPLRSPLLALARECARAPSSPTDAIVRYLRPRIRTGEGPDAFVDWNPEGVMFRLPGLHFFRNLPFRTPPRWIVLPDAGPGLLDFTIIGHLHAPPPDRKRYTLTIRRPPMEAAADFAYVLDYVQAHSYRAIALHPDLAGDNMPEFFAHYFAPAAYPVRLTLYEYESPWRERK